MATAAEYRKDTARLNQLEKLAWVPETSGLAIFPLLDYDNGQNGAKVIQLCPLNEEEDGSGLCEALCEGPTLREAIDLAMGKPT